MTGNLIVVSAPSGGGKTSLVSALLAEDATVALSISYTTRAPRPVEKNGREYHFVDPGVFQAMLERGEFLECAEVHGNRYGTSQKWIEETLQRGKDVLLEIDWQGAQQIRRSFPSAVSLFILPPSHDALLERLRRRGEDNDEAIRKRTAEAVIEMSHHDEYDYVVVNDRFDDAVDDLQAIIRAERLRTSRQVRRRKALLHDLLSHAKPIQ
jgi:guanylate kinase